MLSYLIFFAVFCCAIQMRSSEKKAKKPSPDEVKEMLTKANARFAEGKAEHPRTDKDWIKFASSNDQGKYAIATVVTCADSRVPVERIFDQGVMDIFTIRNAGNFCCTDIESIEYGIAHVQTPLLVILGHTQCGACNAGVQHHDTDPESLDSAAAVIVKRLHPVVKNVKQANSDADEQTLVNEVIEANVWNEMKELFTRSETTRNLVKEGKVKVVGAIYELESGKVRWLDAEKPGAILEEVS